MMILGCNRDADLSAASLHLSPLRDSDRAHLEFADAKARVTRRLWQQIGVDCQSMPTSHAADPATGAAIQSVTFAFRIPIRTNMPEKS
jgi:hypothetical protein